MKKPRQRQPLGRPYNRPIVRFIVASCKSEGRLGILAGHELDVGFRDFLGVVRSKPLIFTRKCYNLGSTLALFLDFPSYSSAISNFQERIETLGRPLTNGRGRMNPLTDSDYE